MTTVLVALGALAVTAGVVELVVAVVARARSERALAAAAGGDVHVRLGGRPVAWHLARRRLPRVWVTARAVPVGDDAELARLDVWLGDVRLPARPAGGGGPTGGRVRAARGSFEARVDSAQLARLADLPPGLTGLRLTDDALRIHTAAGPALETSVTARDGGLLIRADRGLIGVLGRAELRLPLGELPAGARVEHARVEDGMLVAAGSLDGSRL